mmetsp:Transcript_142400/g.455096  ORF Transcript_142400/g.455096 Transcript_142400/m.455096 type:complete len:259 (-) Transcript_142400:822-1598(-)
MVCVFLAFSSSRNEVALETASSSSATSLESSATSSVSLAMEEVSSSISARNVSTESVFSLRVCSFVASSLSHQPLCSASSLASSMRRTTRSLIIFLTCSNGSEETRVAKLSRMGLESSWLLFCKYSTTRACAPRCERPMNTETRAVALPLLLCAKDGKYVSALPFTAEPEMISMALLMASSSSARRAWRDSKSLAFCSQVAERSPRYASSASRVATVSLKSPSAVALDCIALALASDFSSLSAVAWVTWAVRSCINIS